MSNLTRYDLGGYDCGQTCTACGMEVSAEGEYVKFDDIKKLLNSSYNKQSTPCFQCAEYLRDGGANYCPNCGNKLK